MYLNDKSRSNQTQLVQLLNSNQGWIGPVCNRAQNAPSLLQNNGRLIFSIRIGTYGTDKISLIYDIMWSSFCFYRFQPPNVSICAVVSQVNAKLMKLNAF